MTRTCQVQGGGQALCPHNQKVKKKFTQMTSHSSMVAVSKILDELQETIDRPVSLKPNPAIKRGLTIEFERVASADEPAAGAEEPAPKGCMPAPFCCEAYGVARGPSGSGIMCSPEPPDGVLLHDKVVVDVGKYKDQLDELTMTMNKKAFLFEDLKLTLNDQLTAFTNSHKD